MNKNGVSIMAMSKSGAMAVVVCLAWCLVAACPTRAEESEYVKNGFYVGGMFAYNWMTGDFDDRIPITYEEEEDQSDVFDIPDVDDGAGFGLVVGRRYDWISLEFGYQRTVQDTYSSLWTDVGGDAVLLIGDSEATYEVFDLNVKIDVFAMDRLRPYVLLGGGFTTLTIEDSRSADYGETWNKDADYSGYCLNAGVGVAYYFHPQWAVTGGFIHRWNEFNHLKGDLLKHDLAERALGFTVGLAYTF
ncbi:MAG: outer membrane beta-barrel protein [Solirubrobacterales bacterium]